MRLLDRIGALTLVLWLSGCAGEHPQGAAHPEGGDPGRPTAAVATTGRVTLASFALAGRVAWHSVETAGTALGALFTGGTAHAERRWQDGARKTRHVARVEAASVKAAARAR